MATGPATSVEPNDWQTVEPNDWQDVSATPVAPDSHVSKFVSSMRGKPSAPRVTEGSEHLRQLHQARSAQKELVDPTMKNLPVIGGVVGGAVGSLGGPAGAVLGATYGGYVGTGLKRDYEKQPRSTMEEVKGGAEQGAYELGGQVGARVLGRLAKPVLEKYPQLMKTLGIGNVSPNAVGHLTAAASEKGGAGPTREAIAATIGDIEGDMEKLPPEQRNVEGFLNAVTAKRAALHDEYENALGPVANQEAGTESIVRQILDLKKSWMDVGKEGAAEKKAIEDAAVRFRMPRTVGQLDSLRQQLNSDLAGFYAKAPNARYAAENGNVNLAIDAAIARGARDVLYPIADKAAGKPAGYFADVLDREGNLIQLRGILKKRIQDLGGSQAISEVTPAFGAGNISLSAHAGSPLRAGLYGLHNVLTPPRELTAAGKHVAKAFGPQINTLPYGVLFSDAARASHFKGSNTQQLEKTRAAQQSEPTE